MGAISKTANADGYRSFRTFHIWDLPGQINYLGSNFDSRAIFEDAGVMAWVIDAQDDYTDSVNRLGKTVLALQENYPEIKIAVFIHKTDSLSSDFRDEVVRDITQRITDELNDAGLENPPIAFYPTSVYDTSIFEAMSKVMQLMVPQYDNFEALLSNIATNCKFQKLYLFDNMTKLYFASDTSPADTRSYNLCQDFFDSIVDLAEMFNYNRKAVTQQASQQGGSSEQNGESSQQGAAVQAPVPMKNQAHSFVGGSRGCFLYLQEINPYASPTLSSSNHTDFTLRHFSIIGWSREPNFAQEKSQVDYNVTLFSEAFKKVLAHTNA